MKEAAALSAALVIFVGGFLVACGASGKKPGTYGSSTTVSGVGSGGLVGSGVRTTTGFVPVSVPGVSGTIAGTLLK